jgi:O-antigen/teichoic acid export membrane protein
VTEMESTPAVVETVVEAASVKHHAGGDDTTARHIRSSSVLLVGRVLTLALNFGSYLLLARYLSRADYGAMSYALAAVSFLQSFATFELSSALSRWLPMYRERQQYGAAYGSVALAFAFVLVMGGLVAAALMIGVPRFGAHLIDDPEARRLLVILALLIPIQGVDTIVTSLFAILGETRTLLIRGSILAPGLKIGLVAILVALRASVSVLAWGYLAISAIGLAYFGWSLWRTVQARGLLRRCRPSELVYPVRTLFAFASPLIVTALVWSLMESSDALMLGYFHGVEAVAGFRAVMPLAQLNKVATLAFGAMYLPVASRLYARGEQQNLSELYWRTAVWMAALSFPVFLCTFSFARPTASLLYGHRYLDSVPVLSILSLGYFVHTALGFNGLTLKTFNKLRYTVCIDLAAAVLNVAVNLLLIPRWGPLGAAAGTSATLVAHNVLKQYGLWKYTGIPALSRAYLSAYAALFGLPLLLLALQSFLPPTLWIALPLSAVACVVALWSGRRALAIHEMFPEVGAWRLRVALRRRAVPVR